MNQKENFCKAFQFFHFYHFKSGTESLTTEEAETITACFSFRNESALQHGAIIKGYFLTILKTDSESSPDLYCSQYLVCIPGSTAAHTISQLKRHINAVKTEKKKIHLSSHNEDLRKLPSLHALLSPISNFKPL